MTAILPPRTWSAFLVVAAFLAGGGLAAAADKPRVIVTTDGEIDDECSLVRFLLYANEWDVEGIVTSSSQYHWQGHKWAGDDWARPYLQAYAQVHPNLLEHDRGYPSPGFLQARTVLGNVKAEGEMTEVTPGSELIARVLLDESDPRPVWIQAWGGTNTIARALQTIEQSHPEKMAAVAAKLRLYLIWEQDATYQDYIRPHWGKYGILTIVSDQFIALFYHWKKYLPAEQQAGLGGSWMKANILEHHGPLCSLYKAHGPGEKGFDEGDFRSEGDSPAFLHVIPTGLRSVESPGWGGWGGRFVRVRDNTWLDPVDEPGYQYPEGRWYADSAWGRTRLRKEIPNDAALTAYLEPQWRWLAAIQNDFAARADWCVRDYAGANHPPVAVLAHAADLTARPGDTVQLSARGSSDPDGDELTYRWWQDREAGTGAASLELRDAGTPSASFVVPSTAASGQTLHLVCEVTDHGTPRLTRYRRVIVTMTPAATDSGSPVRKWGADLLRQEPAWYATAEARATADRVRRHQSVEGAWPKNTDLLLVPPPPEAPAAVAEDGKANTIDNGATTTPIRFLALVAQGTGAAEYRRAVGRGLDYLLASQYPNGGFPQFFPLRKGYYAHITYNDDAMINALTLLREVAQGTGPFDWVDGSRRARSAEAVARGIECILKTQVRQDGRLTVWCAQHDEVTLAPAWARAYEPPSLSGQESVGVVRFLMAVERPSPAIVGAIEGAVAWFRAVTMTGQRIDRIERPDGRVERMLATDPSAPPLWARFYELGTNRPLYMDRRSQPIYDFSQVDYERRSGYSYHTAAPAELLGLDYPSWLARRAKSSSMIPQPSEP